jgi:CDP-diacylglycerol--glycerol-3-phosphate 3-phosphatidyltransferase
MILKEKIRKLFSNVWTIPNVLTIIRIILIPVFVVLFFKGQKIAALCVFCAASLTDMLDGYLARKLNQITDFGKLFDPLADKLMVLTAMVCQTFWGPLPLVAVIIVAVKELVMVLGGVFMLSKDVVVYSNYFGKAAQVGFIASLILSFFHDNFLEGNVVLWGMTPDILLLWVTVALAVIAMAVYAAGAIRTIRGKNNS